MVAIRDIKDEGSLSAWLDGQPREAAGWIGVRAALQVAPLVFAEESQRTRELAMLPVLRCLLTAWVADKYPTGEVLAAAAAAPAAVLFHRVAYANFIVAAIGEDADDATIIRSNAARAAFSAAYAAALSAAYAAALSASAASFAAAAADPDGEWAEIRADAQIAAGWDWGSGDERRVPRAPLWHGGNPFADDWAQARKAWQARGGAWAFWAGWYQGEIDGREPRWELLKQIALIPPADWDKGEAHVHPIIERIVADFAIAATFNAERIEVNPATLRVRLVPDSDLSADTGEYARRKMAKARAMFGDTPSNQYTALAPELALIDDTLADAANLPVELFDICASVSRRVAARARLGECPEPEKDPLLADFLTRMRECGADILGSDPKTQQVLSLRNEITGNSALIDGQAVMIAAAAKIAMVAEGPLARLPDLAGTATDATADPEDRKVASFKLVGRILRVAKIAGAVPGFVSDVIVGIAKIIAAWTVIYTSPEVAHAVQLILRWLGFL